MPRPSQSDADLVAGLDRDRLLELAEWCSNESRAFRRLIVEMETGNRVAPGPRRTEMSDRFAQLAALCRVVAGAEKAMAGNYLIRACAVGVPPQFFCGASTPDPVHWDDRHPTLASALGAVAEGVK